MDLSAIDTQWPAVWADTVFVIYSEIIPRPYIIPNNLNKHIISQVFGRFFPKSNILYLHTSHCFFFYLLTLSCEIFYSSLFLSVVLRP